MSVLALYVLIVLPTALVAAAGTALVLLGRRVHGARRSGVGIDPAVNARKSEAVVRLADRRLAS